MTNFIAGVVAGVIIGAVAAFVYGDTRVTVWEKRAAVICRGNMPQSGVSDVWDVIDLQNAIGFVPESFEDCVRVIAARIAAIDNGTER